VPIRDMTNRAKTPNAWAFFIVNLRSALGINSRDRFNYT